MPIEIVLELNFERWTAYMTLWGLYVTLVVAIYAYIAATDTKTSPFIVRLLLTVGFTIFSLGNLSALDQIRGQRAQLTCVGAEKIARPSEDLSQFCNQNRASFTKLSLNLAALRSLEEKGDHKIRLSSPGNKYADTLENDESDRVSAILSASKPIDRAGLMTMHIVFDLITICTIWFVPGVLVAYRRIRRFDQEKIDIEKSPFSSPIISWIQAREKWQLVADYQFQMDEFDFTVPQGFSFDLASIPRILVWIINVFELSVTAPLVHDYLYSKGGRIESVSEPIDRNTADDLFFRIMKREGVSGWRRYPAYFAVRCFGFLSWRSVRE